MTINTEWGADLRKRTVVCDTGTGYLKCGLAGDKTPRAIIPAIVGRPFINLHEATPDHTIKDRYIADECLAAKERLHCSYPVSNGIVSHWDDMTALWEYAFHTKLGVTPSDCKVLLTDPPLNPTANRTRMLEIMFERFVFAGAFIQIQAVLTLYSQGLLTGVVLDSGDGVTHSVPVVDGFSPSMQIRRLNVAGRHITMFLGELLTRRGYALNSTADVDVLRQIKERVCYVADDYARELKIARETVCLEEHYTLPDGRTIKVGAERFMAPEALFTPSLVNLEGSGLAEMVFDAIQTSDVDSRMRLYEHIVLSGGNTMFPGLPTRLEKEIKQLYCSRVLQGRAEGLAKLKLRIEDPPTRKFMVFVGGAVLADIMKDRNDFWVTKEEWEEDPHRALKKCAGGGGG